MRKKLPVLLLVLIILLQAFVPVAYAASKNEEQSQTAYFCPSDATSEGAGKVVPDKAHDIANQVKVKNGAPPQGYKGGKTFNNQPVNGGQKLPDGVKYKEYDVNPYVKGQNRGTERIVIGDDGSVWYTNDHYHTFTIIE